MATAAGPSAATCRASPGTRPACAPSAR